MYDNLSRVIEVDIDEILPNRFQPRIQFDEEEILELSDSIKEHGVIQPLVVRTIGDKYEIIAGERRYKASVLAGRETVPVIIKNLNDKDSAEIALIENIQRKNLTPIEEALSYKKILDMGYITQENLASKLGKSQSAVANKIRLLNLSDEVQEALLENKISERHARSLLKLETSKQQNEMLNKIISERLTVRKVDEEIEKIKNNIVEEINNIEEKMIEKGEKNMNNNMFGIPNVPQNQQPTPNFDIFGTSNPQPTLMTQSEVTATPIVEQPQNIPSFDIFTGTQSPVVENTPSMPVTNIVPEVPAVPEMPTMGGSMFDIPAVPVQPEVVPTSIVENTPSMSATNIAPEVPVVPEMPTIGGNIFNIPAVPVQPEVVPTSIVENTPSMPVTNIAPEAPVVPNIPTMGGSMFDIPAVPVQPEDQFIVPQTAPIMESPVVNMNQQSENLFSFGGNITNQEKSELETSTTIPEFKMPEPIIITDYSKQYDPIMPVTPENIAPTVDFKEVISAIRECSNKIERYGFKIDVEEYDLANLYQVIFKIEK